MRTYAELELEARCEELLRTLLESKEVLVSLRGGDDGSAANFI
jgi:hypothetical protein